jgi:CWF19-like protein 1
MNVGFVYQIQIWRTLFSLKMGFMLAHLAQSKHLIVAIGSECYVTLPKGQIIPTQSAADHVDIPGGGHVLIIPITHYPTYSTIPPDLAQPIVEETDASAFL